MPTKQVIVMRKDLQMRKGKMIAQGAHASMAFITRRLQRYHDGGRVFVVDLRPVEQDWLDNSFTKICVSVNSEEELLAIKANADAAGLECHLIQDNGLTEFGGVPTYTCLAIGPDESSWIDVITGHLGLL